ncbi:MAG: hypothetical protein ACLFQB_05880 [Chitinispirillaceae bacterium]
MAQEENVKTLERGSIYFFYRPKVGAKHPESESEIQRFYMVMSPDQQEQYRMAVVGKKELPEPEESGHQRYWGYVTSVKSSPEQIRDELGEEKYSTKTRGERTVEMARPAGEGVYKIILHKGHTHLAYVLELPKKPSRVQEELNIEDQASYVITVKNPDKPSPRSMGISSSQQAEYPAELMEKFRGRRFSQVDPPGFLDFEGTQFVLVAASDNIKEELGAQIRRENEGIETADIYTDLKMDREKRPRKPLFRGEWE